MATEFKLPDLGEGIEDVTINRWFAQEGESVTEGEPLLEVATDKVDTEVPAPQSGTLLRINFSEGDLVDINEVLAVIGEEGESTDDAEPSSSEEEEPAEEGEASEPDQSDSPDSQEDASEEQEDEDSPVRATPVARRVAQEEGVTLSQVPGTGSGGQITKSDVLDYINNGDRQSDEREENEFDNLIPLSVRRVAADYDVDLREVAGERPLSQLSRHDVLQFVSERDGIDFLATEPGYEKPAAPSEEAEKPRAAASEKSQTQSKPAAKSAPSPTPQEDDELVAHTRMRTLIAKNMVQSAFTAPHVTTMWDVNMSAVIAHRKANKGEFAKSGVNLTLTAYLVQAIVAGLRAVPAANAQWSDDGVIIKRAYNIGMAVAIPANEQGLGGLIVPVIKNVGELNLLGIARQVNELAQKARNNQLAASDLQGGTFTLTNYGTSGSRFQTPVIMQPQVGILGVGAIEKRPIVVSQGHPLEANNGDYLTFAPMTTLGFSYDHRVLDGATADAFCAAVKDRLEKWSD